MAGEQIAISAVWLATPMMSASPLLCSSIAVDNSSGANTNKIVVAGYSAGGMLSLLAAGTNGNAEFEGSNGTPGVSSEVNASIGVYPLASADNAKCKRYWSATDDGLSKDWTDEVVWLNPPYGKGVTTKWVAKAYRESKCGATVVMVVPVRADAKWWHDYAMKAEVRLFRNRLNFDNDHGAKHYAPFATAVLVFRPYQFRLVSMPEVSAMGYLPNDQVSNPHPDKTL